MPEGQVAVRQESRGMDRADAAIASPSLLAAQERVMRAGARGYSLPRAFELWAHELDVLVGLDCAGLLSWREEYRDLRIEALAGEHRDLLEPAAQLPLSEAVIALTATRPEPLVCPDTRRRTNHLQRFLARAGILSCAIIPLATRGKQHKLLVLASRHSNQYNAHNIAPLQQLAEAIRASLCYCQQEPADTTERGRYPDGPATREQQRLIAEVSRGVVHSLNNVFALLLGNLQLLQKKAGPSASTERLEQMQGTVLRGTAMLRALDQFSANGRGGDREVLDLGAVAQEVIDLTAAVWKRGGSEGSAITVNHQRKPGVSVHANCAEIKEAVLSIIFNARHALPLGGEIVVSEGYDEALAFVQVADNGVGMDELTRRRATEPFFTTRGRGHHGLGLSVASSIARRHGGHIGIVSTPGAGSTVRLSLDLLGSAESPH